MYALTLLSYDIDYSKKSEKTDWLIEMNQLLFRALKNEFKPKQATIEEKDQVAVFFENLRRLPEEEKKSILGEMNFPKVKSIQPSEPSYWHEEISKQLRR